MTFTMRSRPVTNAAIIPFVLFAAALIAAPANTGSVAARSVATDRSAAAGHDAALTARQQRAVAVYWTPARMKTAVAARDAGGADDADPPDTAKNAWVDGDTLGKGLRWLHDGPVQAAMGKVFFTLNGTSYVCSGTDVRGAAPGENVVLTAAHCTGNGDGDWADNWTFVPGYDNGSQPYGSYTARRFFVAPQWSAETRGASAGNGTPGAEEYDVAFVAVNTTTLSGTAEGARADALPPGQKIAFGVTPPAGTRMYVAGYPAEPPFSGLYADYCAGPVRPGQVTGAAAISCDMTAGDSGGPWLADFDPRSGSGTVVAITSFKYGDDASLLYGTWLGQSARQLYDEASALSVP